MQRDRAKYESELEELRSSLQVKNSTNLERVKQQLQIDLAERVRISTDKIAIYRAVTELLAEVLADFDLAAQDTVGNMGRRQNLDRFNRQRMKMYGFMGMLAPQTVMDAYDALCDLLFEIANGDELYDWKHVRELVLHLLNEIRADIGVDKSQIKYNGRL